MFDPEQIRHIHVLGVCGTGMGSFAGMMRSRGYHVTGSDENVYPPMSTLLAEWGIPVARGYRPENLDPEPDLVVVGNVIRRTNPEAVEVRRRGLSHTSFPDALARLFLADRRPSVVAGTHGKTTTTAILAWLLEAAGRDPGFLMGGVPLDFGRSFQAGAPPHFVVEGDEYDTAYFDKGPKFLHYRPHTAILTSVEFDHADIFADLAAVERAFRRFVALIPRDGWLGVCGHADLAVRIARDAGCLVETYGLLPEHDWQADEVTSDRHGTHFTLRHRGSPVGAFTSPLYGRHNLANVTAALALALHEGVSARALAHGLARFSGIRKRQEVRGVAAGVTVVEDFAHHPTAVSETIGAMRQRYPETRLWAAYHPESNTARRRLFHDEYVEALSRADVALLAAPHHKSDGLAPEERADVAGIAAAVRARGVEARGGLAISDMLDLLADEVRAGDVVLAMSGRDFEGLPDRLLERLRARA